MLAHAASAQGISAVENMCGRPHELNHLSVPAACFTHPEVSFVGLTEEAAREAAAAGGFSSQVAVVKTSFKANSKVRAAPGPGAALQAARSPVRAVDGRCGQGSGDMGLWQRVLAARRSIVQSPERPGELQ